MAECVVDIHLPWLFTPTSSTASPNHKIQKIVLKEVLRTLRHWKVESPYSNFIFAAVIKYPASRQHRRKVFIWLRVLDCSSLLQESQAEALKPHIHI